MLHHREKQFREHQKFSGMLPKDIPEGPEEWELDLIALEEEIGSKLEDIQPGSAAEERLI